MILNPDTLYCSIDLETDGACAGINNVLSMAFVLYDHQGTELSAYDRNLELLPDLKPDHACMLDFWAKHPVAYARARDNLVEPRFVMIELNSWLQRWREERDASDVRAVCYPASFDFAFVNYYAWRFLDCNPLGYLAWDIHSLWAGAGKPFDYDLGNSHVAVLDARNQGELFFRVIETIERQIKNQAMVGRM